MEMTISQLGYMYGKAVLQYGGAFNMRQESATTYADLAAIQGEQSIQGVGEFLAKSSHTMDDNARAEQMAAYSSYLYQKMQEIPSTDDSNQTQINTTEISSFRRITSRYEATAWYSSTQSVKQSEAEKSSEDVLPENTLSDKTELSRDPADILCGESIISDFSYGKHQLDYLFSYDEKGMSCLALYSGEEMWSIDFEDSEQYESVRDFLSDLDTEDNLTFTANDSFWKRFLSGNIDVDDFKETLTHLDNGKVNPSELNGSGKLIGIEYMNCFSNPATNIFRNFRGFPSYEAAIMDQYVSGEYSIGAYFGNHEKYTELFYKENPELKGVKAFWNWQKQEWSTLEDMLDLWDKSEKDKPHYKDRREKAIEEHYKKYPEDLGVKKYMISRSADKDPEMVTYEDYYDWDVAQNGSPSAIAIKHLLGEGDYWRWLNRHKQVLADKETIDDVSSAVA